MKKFSEFKIEAPAGAFEGKKISLEDLFNVPIIVRAFRIEESKFTGSDTLMEMIKKVPEDEFPFETVIKKREKRFEFT